MHILLIIHVSYFNSQHALGNGRHSPPQLTLTPHRVQSGLLRVYSFILRPEQEHLVKKFATKPFRMTVSRFAAFATLFVLLVAYLACNPQLLGYATSTRTPMDEDFNNGWRTSEGTPVVLSDLDSLPGIDTAGVTIQRSLPHRIEPGTELNFISKNCTYHLSYDNIEVYAFDPDSNEAGAPYSTRFNFAPLTAGNASQLVSLTVKSVYPGATQLLDMRISDSAAYIQRFVRIHGIPFAISLVIVFIGFAVLALRVLLRHRQIGDLDLLSLGSISVLLGTWSATETLVPQLVTGLFPLIRALDYLTLLFAPLPIVRFVGSLVRPKYRQRYDNIASVAAISAIGATVIGAWWLGHDMHELLFISHMQLILCVVLIIVEIIAGFRSHGQGLWTALRHTHRAIFIAFLFFVLCSIFDFVIYSITAHGITDSALCLRVGLFVFTGVLALEAFNTSIEYMNRADRAEAVEAIAYVDALTGIGNRAAWQLMISEIDEELRLGNVEDAMVGTFDVNFLKKVNDNYGHSAGDEHLKRAAEVINRSFGTEGACYRTGGDEFTVLLAGIMLDDRLQTCYDMLFTFIEEENAKGDVKVELSMAMGFAKASETKTSTLEAAQRIADKRMYINKHAMKCERKD